MSNNPHAWIASAHSAAEECPTHKLTGQLFSAEEMRFIVAHAKELLVCKDCVHWFKSQLVIKDEKPRQAI